KEVAVRLSLGASRPRLLRQLLTESLLLAGLGGALGILFASWGSRVLSLLMFSGGEPLHFETQRDARVLGFTAVVSLLTGILFAVDPTKNGYEGQRLIDFYGRLLERLEVLPGATNATMSTNALVSGWQSHWPVSIEGLKADPGKDIGADWNNVGPSFFETMGIRLLLGRGVEWRDTSNSPKVAVVNEAFANHFLDGQDPVGHRFNFERFDGVYEIVGLVEDAKYAKLRNAPRPTVYLPVSQMPVPLGDVHFE